MRSVSILSVASPEVWNELEAAVPLGPHIAERLDDLRAIVNPSFERTVLPQLQGQVLIRYARRDPSAEREDRQHVADAVAALRPEARKVLMAAQRHALDGVVIGRQAWDPQHDAVSVRALHGAGLMTLVDDEAAPYAGRYRLEPDLPDLPPFVYDFEDAVMPETEDLSPASPGVVELLHDMAALIATLEQVQVRVTHQSTITLADARRVGKRLASPELAASGGLEAHPRWGRALRALQALQAVSTDIVTRELHLDLGLEATLAGDENEATDRLVHRLVDADLHAVVPAIRQALREAGNGAVDELVFLELLRDQHRDVLIPAWLRDGDKVYPVLGDEAPRAYNDDNWDVVEARMVRGVLGRLVRMGILRRAPGVFAATADGRIWAGVTTAQHPPLWVTGDLEIIVPPGALTPWERFQVERLSRCLQRDTVDRYRLERAGLATWLSTHELADALDLLRRRCPALPRTLMETLEVWERSATRVVLTRGVLV
jgi:hypothetical protein